MNRTKFLKSLFGITAIGMIAPSVATMSTAFLWESNTLRIYPGGNIGLGISTLNFKMCKVRNGNLSGILDIEA